MKDDVADRKYDESFRLIIVVAKFDSIFGKIIKLAKPQSFFREVN